MTMMTMWIAGLMLMLVMLLDHRGECSVPENQNPSYRLGRRLLTFQPDLGGFLDLVSSNHRVDLVLLLDRSQSMTAHTFYTVQIRVIEDILRYYTNMTPDRVRLAVVTFGADGSTVVFDAISSTGPEYKCELFLEPMNGMPSTWKRVSYNYSTQQGLSGIRDALSAAHDTLSSSSAEYKTVLVTWDGAISDNNHLGRILTLKDQLESLNSTLYTFGCGPQVASNGGNLLVLASDNEKYGEEEDWQAAMDTRPTIVEKYVSDLQLVEAPSLKCTGGGRCNQLLGFRECVCDVTYEPCYVENLGMDNEQAPVVKTDCGDDPCLEGQGRCIQGNDTWVCLCEPGYSGRFCEVNDDECQLELCRNDASCFDRVNNVFCSCTEMSCGDFCQQDTDCPVEGANLKVILLVLVPVIIVVIILIAVVIWFCRWITKNVPDETGHRPSTETTDRGRRHVSISLPTSAQLRTGVPAAAREMARRISRAPSAGRPISRVPPLNIKDDPPEEPAEYHVNPAFSSDSPKEDEDVLPVYQSGSEVTSGRTSATDPVEMSTISRQPTLVPGPPPMKRQTVASAIYQNLPVTSEMEEWSDYVLEMTEVGGIDKVCIVRIGEEATQWIATSLEARVSYTQPYLDALSQRLHDSAVVFSQVEHTILSNDGTCLTAVSGNNAALCIAESGGFLVFVSSEDGSIERCGEEAMAICDHLRLQTGNSEDGGHYIDMTEST